MKARIIILVLFSDHDIEKINRIKKIMGLYELFKNCLFSDLALKYKDFFLMCTYIIRCSIHL